jgi:hypothetical protein
MTIKEGDTCFYWDAAPQIKGSEAALYELSKSDTLSGSAITMLL